MRWTPEQDAMLAELWDRGWPTAKIAEDLGITKNAAIGRAHRIGLKPRPAPVDPTKRRDAIARASGRGCQYIAGDAAGAVRAGKDPHCGEPVQPGSAYCGKHHALCYRAVGGDAA